jgi:hypothetical protein
MPKNLKTLTPIMLDRAPALQILRIPIRCGISTGGRGTYCETWVLVPPQTLLVLTGARPYVSQLKMDSEGRTRSVDTGRHLRSAGILVDTGTLRSIYPKLRKRYPHLGIVFDAIFAVGACHLR